MRRLIRRAAVCVAAIVVVPAGVHAQETPMADPADVGSIDAIVEAVYDVISGPAGPRNWDRFRSLFAPGAQLIPTGRQQDTGEIGARRISVEEYVTNAGDAFRANRSTR